MSAPSVSAELASQLRALAEAGINNPEQFAALGAESIANTLRWFEAQKSRRGIGAGVLMAELRNGGRTAQVRRTTGLLAQQAAYTQRCEDWLRAKFPELVNSHGRVHPAAMTAVFLLHGKYGKGTLTIAEHGPEIHARVAAFLQRHHVDMDGNELPELEEQSVELPPPTPRLRAVPDLPAAA